LTLDAAYTASVSWRSGVILMVRRAIDYVKYGSKQVAQIITYGKMATKSAIRDTARVLDLPLFEADKIAKLIPG
jgi:DNA polymerase III alpha subunit